jgi:hypothetical protein
MNHVFIVSFIIFNKQLITGRQKRRQTANGKRESGKRSRRRGNLIENEIRETFEI